MNNIAILYHKDCPDGFASAYAAWKIYGKSALYIPCQHGDAPPDVTDMEVFVCDFSYPKYVFDNLLQSAKKITVLDHHKSAYDNLKDYPNTFFDLDHSGAYITWKYFHKDKPFPLFMKYIEDIDMWRFQYKETRPFSFALRTFPFDFNVWKNFEDDSCCQNVVEQGKYIVNWFDKEAENISENAVEIMFDGCKGLMVNCNYTFASDIGHLLSEKSGTFALMWYVKNNDIRCSLRSVAGFDCIPLAKLFGGGGHPQASGFSVNSLEELFSKVKIIK